MASNMYLDILSRLNIEGPLIEKEITRIMHNYCTDNDMWGEYWNLKASDMERFLKSMQDAGHITFRMEEKKVKGKGSPDVIIFATLQPPGFAFLQEHRINYWSMVRSWIAIVISVISAGFTAWSAFNSYHEQHVKRQTQPLENKKEYHKGISTTKVDSNKIAPDSSRND